MMDVREIAKRAHSASGLKHSKEEVRNKMLLDMAKSIEANKDEIFKANVLDLEESKYLVEKGEISQATYSRLKLDENKMRDMIQGIKDVAELEDPINKIFWRKKLDDGLILEKISCPIGVIGVIFEARPDVISQVSALCIKSGNAVLLKGGKESLHTNRAIFKSIQNALPDEYKNTVNMLESREDVTKMLELDEYINLIIPRGSNELVKHIQNNTKIPVLGHAAGICHIYVHKDADYEMAKNICIDAKTQYPSACNAVETILIHRDFPYIDELNKALGDAGIEVREGTDSWGVEFGDMIVSVRVVEDVVGAATHIKEYGSGHTESIISKDKNIAELFMSIIDSAGVFHNVSTRFSDGFRYGFGAEVGISTNKTHARGPVGLDGLTIYKYKLRGEGSEGYIVKDYCDGIKTFKHEMLK